MKLITGTKYETLEAWRLVMICGDDRSLWKTTSNQHCFVKMEITGNDVGYRLTPTQEGGEKKVYGVICPECGEFTELPIDAREIPAYVKYNAVEV